MLLPKSLNFLFPVVKLLDKRFNHIGLLPLHDRHGHSKTSFAVLILHLEIFIFHSTLFGLKFLVTVDLTIFRR